jgi:predicted nucleotidyltransferase
VIIYRALDEVFRAWSHVAVLRALLDTVSGCSGNEVARMAGMHPRSALKALTSLEALGMVRRQRGGRDHIFTLNRDHHLVQEAVLPLYAIERRFPEEITAAIAAVLTKRVLSAVVFGSVAKHLETPQSDLDLCCIVKEEGDKEKVRTILVSEASGLHRKFGVKVAPLFFTLSEFLKKSKSPLVRNIVKNGIVVTGKNPGGLLNDKTKMQETG